MYGGYLMLRQVIEEPTQRARISAVLSIFTFPAVVITYKAIDWWRTQHPGPVLSIRRAAGAMDPAMEAVLYLEYSGRAAVRGSAAADPYAAGRNAPRTRRTAPGGACDIEWTTRNFTYMFYGFAVAWVAVIVYVLTLVSRERKLSEEMRRLRKMIESGDRRG